MSLTQIRGETLTNLFDEACRTLIYSKADQLDYQSSIDCHRYDVVAKALSMEWSYDLKTQWLTRGRWATLVRQYLDPEAVEAWLSLCAELTPTKDRGVASLRTKLVKPRMHGTKASRRFGSCMLALSYRAIPQPTITLHSRASYLGYLGPLDLTVAYVAAKYVGSLHDVPPKDFAFTWYCEALQWPNYKSLGYMLARCSPSVRHAILRPEAKLGGYEKNLIQTLPVIRHSRKWMRRYIEQDNRGLTYGEAEKYGAVRRIRQRFHAEYKPGFGEQFTDEDAKALKPLPSVELNEMTFAPIGVMLT